METNKYYEINKPYLANSLCYLGFKFFKFNDEDRTRFSFKNTEEFQEALNELLELRKKYNKY